MLGLGFSEILCIVIIGVIILGPEHTPKAARKIGQWLAKMRSAATSLNDAIAQDETLSSLQKDVREVQKSVRDIGKHMEPQKLLHDVNRELNDVNRELNDVNHILKDEPSPQNASTAVSQVLTSQTDNVSTPDTIADEPPAVTTASRLFEHIDRFYDEKRGMRTIRLSKAILVPSRIARATSRFSHALAKPQKQTAFCLPVRLRPPVAARAVEKYRLLPSPRKTTCANCHAFVLDKPQNQ